MAKSKQAGFWNDTFGRVLRWIILIPAALILFDLAVYPPLMAVSFLDSLDAPAWAIVIIVLMGGGFLIYIFVLGGMLAAVMVSAIAPNTQLGVSIVGILYFLLQTGTVIHSAGNYPWFITLTEAIVGLTILGGLVSAYAEDT